MTPDHSALIERPCAATDQADLRDRIMNPNVAKSEAEWWASREIERLESTLRELTEWRDIATAPKDRTPILARIHDDLFPRIVGEGRSDLERWNGQRVAVHHPGLCEDGFDLGWGVSAPVGVGLGRDDWFAGWLPLPSAPNQAKEAGE